MSNPPVTNLSDKFAALQLLLTTQQAELMDALAALRGTAPNNSLYRIYEAISAQAGEGSLLDVSSQIEITNTHQSAANAILARLIAQFDQAVEVPTMKDLLLTVKDNTTEIAASTAATATNTSDIADNTSDIADNTSDIAGNTNDPLTTTPEGMCANPYRNSGVDYNIISAQFVEPMTVALWDTPTPPYNFTRNLDLAGHPSGLSCDDWTQYRIYVASRASQFGIEIFNLQKLDTNRWITLSGNNTFTFFVNGNENLKVYICPV